MKTTRLEQLNSYQTDFESTIIAIDNEGWLALAESLFYPTSGGQLFDTGKLNDLEVLEVEKREDAVWHKVASKSLKIGDSVKGTINWSRRYRHMQRHTAQHLLSQAFLRFNPAFETKSVSLSDTCTIDFSGQPSLDNLEKAEHLVNQIVYKNLPIDSFEISEADIADYPLRRPPKVSGRIRIVQMGNWEVSACGGTHLKTTAEAAPIKLLRSERIREGLNKSVFYSRTRGIGRLLRKTRRQLYACQRFQCQSFSTT